MRSILLLLCLLIAACVGPDAGTATLAVNVHGSVSVQPTSFSGYYIYEDNNGDQVRRSLTGSGNYNDVFAGKRVVLVAVRRTSDEGLIGLVVTSDGKILFDSGMLQTNELILYEADG